MSVPAGIDEAVYAQALADVVALRPYGTYQRPVDDRLPPTTRPQCGTTKGLGLHRKAHEHSCEPCKGANAAKRSMQQSVPGDTGPSTGTTSRKDSA